MDLQRPGDTSWEAGRIWIQSQHICKRHLLAWPSRMGGSTRRSAVYRTFPRSKSTQLVEWITRDDLFLQALQSFEMLPIQGAFPKRVIRGVLEGSLPNEPKSRMKCEAIVELFRSDRIFSYSQRNTSSYITLPRYRPCRNGPSLGQTT